jgi:hypothetical protein
VAGLAASFDIRQIGGVTIATKAAMIALAKRAGLARKPEDRRLVHPLKGLPGDNQDANVSRGPFRECVAAA